MESRTIQTELERKCRILQEMKKACEGYVRQPIYDMTPQEVKTFVSDMARRDRASLRMDDDETMQYAGALLSSIEYFNRRSAEHAECMRYREECRIAEEESRKRREAMEREREKHKLYIKIM